jgi:cytoskeletal protein RodZ
VSEQQGEKDLMMQRLRERFAQDQESEIVPRLMRWFADPLKPEDENGRFRPNPAVLLVAVVGMIAVGAFFYFGWTP